MKICESVYFVLGVQLCKYEGHDCPYQSEQYIAQLGKEEAIVTFCGLSNLEQLLKTDD